MPKPPPVYTPYIPEPVNTPTPIPPSGTLVLVDEIILYTSVLQNIDYRFGVDAQLSSQVTCPVLTPYPLFDSTTPPTGTAFGNPATDTIFGNPNSNEAFGQP
jgi:hypothetical protein